MINRLLFSLLVPVLLHGAATIVIVNSDPAGVGFNDATIAAPVGGNSGTTLGQQRLIAFQSAANIWGATLTSSVTIRVLATFEALTCTETGAVLGSAGTQQVFRDFPGAPLAGHWYHQALTSKLAATNADPAIADIRARFNINLGQPGCLTGTFFYLGLDNNHGSNVDLVAVLLHEFAHGLGFSTFTNSSTGTYLSSYPANFDKYLFDTTTGLAWDNMTAAQRAASAIAIDKLVWNGTNVLTDVPSVLSPTPEAAVTTTGLPVNITGNYAIGLSTTFGPALNSTGVTADLMPISTDGCTALTGANAIAVNGKIALIDRGSCGFAVKALNAQNAGAVGVIIANNAPGAAPSLGGTEPLVTIPTVSVSQADGATFRTALAYRSRTRSGVVTSIRLSSTRRSGADALSRVLMYTPNPLQAGSSVSHWDTTTLRNQLMEPAINADLTHNVTSPFDLTFSLLKDIGW